MKAIVGLGNPGARYAGTRHNVGFQVVEELAARLGAGPERELCGALVHEADELLLVRPQTFMNRSGHSARCLADRYGLAAGDFLIVYDDVALPLGALRLRGQGSPGGHRGLESVLESLGSSEVPRLRLGVAGAGLPAPGAGLADYVLAPFDAGELAAVEELLGRAAAASIAWREQGLERAMAQHNGPAKGAPNDPPPVLAVP